MNLQSSMKRLIGFIIYNIREVFGELIVEITFIITFIISVVMTFKVDT